MSLRILLVTDHYPPFIGGAHRQSQLLARKLVERGHQVQVATPWQPGLRTERDEQGVVVHRVKQLRTVLPLFMKADRQQHQPPFPDPITAWSLRRIINHFNPDVVHVYGWMAYALALAMSGKRTPLILASRDYAYSCPNRTMVHQDREICTGPDHLKCLSCAAIHYGKPRGWMATIGVYTGRPLLKRRVTAAHSISTYVRDIVQRDFFDRSLMPLEGTLPALPHAVIPSFMEGAPSASHSGDDPSLAAYTAKLPDEPFILFVGALRRVKGVDQLLTAYQRLASPPPLVLIGTVERDTPTTIPTGVVVLHDFPHAAVMAAWERSLFGVIPSLWPEPLGSVVYEGMSQGRAVIGTKPGGHTDMIVGGETGFLVPAGDVDALIQAMQCLIDNRDLRERLGVAARSRARIFTDEYALPAFEQFYLTVTAGRENAVPIR